MKKTIPFPNYLAFIDVGHGNSSVLVDSKGVVLFDVGPRNALLDFLKEQRVKKINTVIISHADSDHIGALLGLISSNEFVIDRVILNSDSSKNTAAWDDLLFVLNSLHCKGKIKLDIGLCEQSDTSLDKGNVHIDILAPNRYLTGKGVGSTDRSKKTISPNSISAVIKLSLGGKPLAIIASDIDDVGLSNIDRKLSDTKAPILVFPHHGGKPGAADIDSFVKNICKMTHPEIVIFSIGRGRHGTPNPAIVHAIKKTLPKVRIICTQISEHCAQLLSKPSSIHLSEAFACGKESNCCCGGTIIIPLSAPNKIIPSPYHHRQFIKITAPTALCQ